MSHLGIDYGKKYIGIAVSDQDGQMAFAHKVINNTPKKLNEISEIIKERGIKVIIIGDSFDQNGKPNNISNEIHNFAESLKQILDSNINIYFEKEGFTSAHARNTFEDYKTKGRVDASAAALILQRYLDRNNKI